jgi:hypothetical protein
MKYINSSEGTIVVNKFGVPMSDLPFEYRDIVCFDLRRLQRMCDELGIENRDGWDILAVGYWNSDGSYEEPCPEYTQNGFMRHLYVGDARDVDEAIELENERNPYAGIRTI